MDLKNKIEKLKHDTKAESVLVITSGGNLVESAGTVEKFNSTAIYALLAGIFVASKEVTVNIEEKNKIKVSYLESELYNIYISSINEDHLLIVIFKDKSNKGIVWYFGQQLNSELNKLLANDNTSIIPKNKFEKIFSTPIEDELNASLNSLWDLQSNKKTSKVIQKEELTSSNEASIITYDEAVRKGIFKDKKL